MSTFPPRYYYYLVTMTKPFLSLSPHRPDETTNVCVCVCDNFLLEYSIIQYSEFSGFSPSQPAGRVYNKSSWSQQPPPPVARISYILCGIAKSRAGIVVATTLKPFRTMPPNRSLPPAGAHHRHHEHRPPRNAATTTTTTTGVFYNNVYLLFLRGGNHDHYA